MRKPNIKIFVAHHKPGCIYEDNVFVPIHAGKGTSKFDLGIQGDNTGDNISGLNYRYSELTVWYWAWKNYNLSKVDYIGLCHYRRYPSYINIENKNISFDVLKKISDSISEYITNNRNYDILLTKKKIYSPRLKLMALDLNIPFGNFELIYFFYHNFFKNYPEYKRDFIHFLLGINYNFGNMFIMKKDLFLDYSKRFFDYLFTLDNKVKVNGINIPYDNRGYGRKNGRQIGCHSEILINIRSHYQKRINDKNVSYDSKMVLFE